MNQEINYRTLYDNLKAAEEQTQDIEQYDMDLRYVILLGASGVGKSACANNIAGKPVIINTLGNIVILESEGVDLGSNSITKEPRLIKIDELKTVICDNPGFRDTEGKIKEIANAYAIDKLFQNRRSPTKVLVFISFHDIYGRREQIEETIAQVERMFPNHDELKQCIGLIISMCENNFETNNILEYLKKRSSPSLESWCNFFLENKQRVFRFPVPKEIENGNQFIHFPDRNNLIQFITDANFDIIKIDHQVGISDSAKQSLEKFGCQIAVKIVEEVNSFIESINIQINECQDAETLKNYIEIIKKIMEGPFNNDDSHSIIQENQPDDQFHFDFSNLKELDKINNFIGKQLNDNEFISSTKKVINNQIKPILENLSIRLENISKQEELNNLREEIQQLKQRENEIDDQQNELDERMIQMQQRENEIDDQQNELDERMIQMQQRENEIDERINELRRRENELNTHQNQIKHMREEIETITNEANNEQTSPFWGYIIGTASVIVGGTAYILSRTRFRK